MSLSSRECGVAWWIACGASNQDIADFYGMSRQTVKNHVTSICSKIGALDRLNIAIWWWRFAVGNERPIFNPDGRVELEKKSRKAYSMARRTLNKDEWLDLCDKYGNKCLCCGSTEKLTRDHIVPISAGGTHSAKNIQPLCRMCNSKKGNKTIDYRMPQPQG